MENEHQKIGPETLSTWGSKCSFKNEWVRVRTAGGELVFMARRKWIGLPVSCALCNNLNQHGDVSHSQCKLIQLGKGAGTLNHTVIFKDGIFKHFSYLYWNVLWWRSEMNKLLAIQHQLLFMHKHRIWLITIQWLAVKQTCLPCFNQQGISSLIHVAEI